MEGERFLDPRFLHLRAGLSKKGGQPPKTSQSPSWPSCGCLSTLVVLSQRPVAAPSRLIHQNPNPAFLKVRGPGCVADLD